MNRPQPYSQEEHWKSFWRMFYQQQKEHRIIEMPITPEMREEAKRFSQQIIQVKQKERHHQLDSNQEWKRWMTGSLGEIVLETFLGKPFRDVTIGQSYSYAVPDLAPIDLKMGVKSFQVGNFPLVNRSKYHASGTRSLLDGQIFVGIAQNHTRAFLFGAAFDEQLYHNECNLVNERFVKDPHALARKTAFTEFESLFTFHSLSELQQIALRYDAYIPNKAKKIS